MSDELILSRIRELRRHTFKPPGEAERAQHADVMQFQGAPERRRGRHAPCRHGARQGLPAGVDMASATNGAKAPGRATTCATVVRHDGPIIRNHPSPSIAAVNGMAIGRRTLVKSATSRSAANRADQHAADPLGIIPNLGASKHCASTQARGVAILTARSSRAEAVEVGIVNMRSGRRLPEEAKALAEHIAQFDPIALDGAKRSPDPRQFTTGRSRWIRARREQHHPGTDRGARKPPRPRTRETRNPGLDPDPFFNVKIASGVRQNEIGGKGNWP